MAIASCDRPKTGVDALLDRCTFAMQAIARDVMSVRKSIDADTKTHRTGRECEWCGKEVVRVLRRGPSGKWNCLSGGDGDSFRYCNKSCAKMHAWNGSREAYVAKVLGSVLGDIVACVMHSTSCVVCGGLVQKSSPADGKKTCSKECRQARIRATTRAKARERYERITGVKLTPVDSVRPCRLCGAAITPTNTNGCGRSVCDTCNVLKIGGHEARARAFGCDVEGVDRLKVFERDRWTCQLCGRQVLKKAKRSRRTGNLHPRTPSLDHIIPLSKGGPHSEANCQCACLSCNVKKGKRRRGQMRLF
jgi:hypothetical protein